MCCGSCRKQISANFVAICSLTIILFCVGVELAYILGGSQAEGVEENIWA